MGRRGILEILVCEVEVLEQHFEGSSFLDRPPQRELADPRVSMVEMGHAPVTIFESMLK
jgi:hypothetical protein